MQPLMHNSLDSDSLVDLFFFLNENSIRQDAFNVKLLKQSIIACLKL